MGKPTCPRCGVDHWRFIRCGEVDQEIQREETTAQRRELSRVRPVWKSDLDRQWSGLDRRSEFQRVNNGRAA